MYIILGDSGVVASNTVLSCNYLFLFFESVSAEGPVTPTNLNETAVAISLSCLLSA